VTAFKTLLCLSLLLLPGCSPFYVIRAGWEEAGILLKRQDIKNVIAKSKADEETIQKLSLVLQAREFSSEIGLKPNESFTQYSKLDRKVLVWVLSASPKTKLEAVTWWFPVVGRVPYKGFFNKKDAIKEFNKLKEKEHDVFLRPSAAFSTLGWFNDPLLSTMIEFEETSLVSTVFHEITHNTVWLPDHVSFNETLANVVGTAASIQFFDKIDGNKKTRSQKMRNTLNDELIYAKYLEDVFKELNAFYIKEDATIEKRELIFSELKEKWKTYAKQTKTVKYQNVTKFLNNAVLLAQKAYYEKPELFVSLLKKHNNSIPDFISEIKEIITETKRSKLSPFLILEQRVSNTKKVQNF